jgi:hypothetical protein
MHHWQHRRRLSVVLVALFLYIGLCMSESTASQGSDSNASNDGLVPATRRARGGNTQASPLVDAPNARYNAGQADAPLPLASPPAMRLAHRRQRAKPLLSSHASAGHRYYTRQSVSILRSVSHGDAVVSGEGTQTPRAAHGFTAPEIPTLGEPAGSPADWGLPEENLRGVNEEEILEALLAADGRSGFAWPALVPCVRVRDQDE